MVGINKEEVFITNIVKCKPPKNRAIVPTELTACRELLDGQIRLINPKLIVCLGKVSANALLGLNKDMGTLTSASWDYNGLQVIVAYHPSSTHYRPTWLSKIEERFAEIKTIVEADEKKKEKKATKTTVKKEPENPEAPDIGQKLYRVETDADGIDVIEHLYQDANIVSFDTETTGLNYKTNHIIGFSLGWQNKELEPRGAYFPLRHKDGDNLNWTKLQPILRKLLEDASLKKILHNAKFDMQMMSNESIKIHNFDDTMMLAYGINEDIKNYGLKHLGCIHVDYKAGYYEEELKKYVSKLGIENDCTKDTFPNYSNIPAHVMGKYAAWDAVLTLELYYKLIKIAESQKKSNGEVFAKSFDITRKRDLEMVTVLEEVERQGLNIDLRYFSQLSGDMLLRIYELKKKLDEIAGKGFNPNSPKQVGDTLINTLGFYPVKRHLRSGAVVVDDATLAEYYQCNWTKQLRTYRSLSKALNTYINPIILKSDGKLLKTNLLLHRTNNGRLASADPNLQNIPKHKKKTLNLNLGDEVRKGFICPEGYTLLFADYSQIELRIGASYSNITKLIEAYKNNEDIHALTAKLIYGKDKVDDEERYFGKTANFLKLYGGGAKPIIEKLISEEILPPGEFKDTTEFAEYLSRRWDETYPQARIFLSYAERKASERGWVKNHLGRLRRFHGGSTWRAFHFLVSSTAADIIKEAMIKLHYFLQDKKSSMILQIHDEVIFKVANEEWDEVVPKVKELMEYSGLIVNIPVDMEKSTTNWTEREEVNI